MSDAAGTAWQRPELVAEFLEQRGRVLPLLDIQEDLIRRVLTRSGLPIRRFVDIGSGAGAMTQLLLGVVPGAEAVLVDYSEPMLRAAESQLAGADPNVRIVRGDLRRSDWHMPLEAGSFDAAVSGLAIHHLDSARKRALYAEVFALLAPGAMFLNMDVVTVEGPLRGMFDEEMAALAIAHEHARREAQPHSHGGGRSDDDIERELLADDSDDQPDTAFEQLDWLREAGFVDVELHFKWAEGAIFGATKPQKGGN